MHIQLKQTEIEASLKDFIIKQGIALKGRTVSIAFTSGRKDDGLIASIDIGDVPDQLPDFFRDEVEVASPLSLVRNHVIDGPDVLKSETPQTGIEVKK